MCGRYYIEAEDMSEQLRQIIAGVERKRGNSEAHAAMRLGEIYARNKWQNLMGSFNSALSAFSLSARSGQNSYSATA